MRISDLGLDIAVHLLNSDAATADEAAAAIPSSDCAMCFLLASHTVIVVPWSFDNSPRPHAWHAAL